jgi:cobalt-zinc-cadmium efflux system outer membrane protein
MTRALALALVLAAAWPALALAEDAPAEITADQAVALYRTHSPRLAVGRAGIGVAETDLIGARIYPNPTVSISSSPTVLGTPTSGETQTQVSVEVPLLLGHQRGRREKAAEAGIVAARAGLAADQAGAEHEIRGLFAALQAAQTKTQLLVAAVADVQIVRGIVAGRTSAGAASPYELERIDLAVATMTSQLGDARTEEALASRALARAVGIPRWQPKASGDLAPGAAAAAATIDPAHPALAAARADGMAARADEDRARSDGVPVPSLSVQSYATSGPFGMAITGGLSIPLPLFDRNQGAVAKARAEQTRAALELAAREHELGADLERARGELAARQEVLAGFETGALSRLTRMRTMAETAYRNGQGGIVELLDAVESITEARLRHVELLHAVVDAELAVRAASKGD